VKLSYVTAITVLCGICGLSTGVAQQGSSGLPASAVQTQPQPVHAPDGSGTSHKPSNVLFSAPLQDVPGKQLVVVALQIPPRAGRAFVAHRHPGSVYVYVTRGTARLAIEGQPVQEVHAGQSFFEPPGALHTVAESASDTESASAIAVMIVPFGAPLVTPEPQK
jgi:quercetin dioxygenase-like cupin family protein